MSAPNDPSGIWPKGLLLTTSVWKSPKIVSFFICQSSPNSTVGLSISRSIFISREREFPKHFGYFPGISRELKTYLIANRKYPIFERKCIFWGSRIILSFVTIIFDSKVWFWAQRKISKIEWNRKICQSQYIKISRNFPGNRKNSRDQAGLKIFGKFPGFPGREFPGTSPNRAVSCRAITHSKQ